MGGINLDKLRIPFEYRQLSQLLSKESQTGVTPANMQWHTQYTNKEIIPNY